MNDLLEVLSNYDTVIYNETMDTLEMILGPTFISIVAGFLLGMTLTALKKGNKFSSVVTFPLRLVTMIIAGYPIILIAILLVPFIQGYVGMIIGVEAAQPLLMFWGTFYFGHLIYRSLTHYQIDGTTSMNTIQNLRQLLLGMIAASAVLGMIGMGGLGGILLQYGFFKADYSFAMIIAVVYAVMILCVELAAAILKSMFKPRHVIMPMTPEYVAQLLKEVEEEEQQDRIVSEVPQKVSSTSEPAPKKPMGIDGLIRRN